MKKDYTLYYDTVNSGKDIERHEFNTHAQMLDFIDEKTLNRKGGVWLLSKDELEDVFVSRSLLSIQDFLNTKHLWQTKGNYHLFECEDLDYAYDLAINITETYHEN